LINTPNTNPERPNNISENQALTDLKSSFDNLFKEFEKSINNSKFLSLFKNPNSDKNVTQPEVKTNKSIYIWYSFILWNQKWQ